MLLWRRNFTDLKPGFLPGKVGKLKTFAGFRIFEFWEFQPSGPNRAGMVLTGPVFSSPFSLVLCLLRISHGDCIYYMEFDSLSTPRQTLSLI